jgi:hypothetical protein
MKLKKLLKSASGKIKEYNAAAPERRRKELEALNYELKKAQLKKKIASAQPKQKKNSGGGSGFNLGINTGGW